MTFFRGGKGRAKLHAPCGVLQPLALGQGASVLEGSAEGPTSAWNPRSAAWLLPLACNGLAPERAPGWVLFHEHGCKGVNRHDVGWGLGSCVQRHTAGSLWCLLLSPCLRDATEPAVWSVGGKDQRLWSRVSAQPALLG